MVISSPVSVINVMALTSPHLISLIHNDQQTDSHNLSFAIFWEQASPMYSANDTAVSYPCPEPSSTDMVSLQY
jgi:hypothetical protein